MEMFRTRASAQEIHACASELAGAGAGQQEPKSARLDEAMDLVEDLGKALDLVDDHQPLVARQLLTQASRIATEGEVNGTVEEIVDPRVLERFSNEKTF